MALDEPWPSENAVWTMTELISLQPLFNESIFVGVTMQVTVFYTDGTLTGSQLSLAKKHHLPLFLHSRAAHNDFVQILRDEGFGEDGGRAVGGRGGVVHSFTGPPQDAIDYVRARDSPYEAGSLRNVPRSTWDFTSGSFSGERFLSH